MSAAVAEAAIANAEQSTTPAAAPAAKPKAVPAPKAEPAKTEAKPDEKAEKPKDKPEPVATPADTREAKIQKFAKRMNAEAEKDGVQLNAPPEETRAKPGPKPGSKRAAKSDAPPAEAKPEPAAQAIPSSDLATGDDNHSPDAAPADADDDDASKPEPRTVHQLKAKARLRHGDVDKAIRIAFGDLKPEEFDATKEALAKKLGVGSKQWADFRRYEAAERAKSKQLEAQAIQLSQRLQADFTPMIEARKAFEAKDYPKAFELAFGEDITAFNRKAIHQKLSQDPEKVRMQQQIDELRAKVERGPAAPPQEAPEQQQAAALKREADRTHAALTQQTDDPEIAHFARKASFVKRVVDLRGEHYDPQTRTTIPLRVAADMARNEIKQHLNEWRYDPEAPGDAAPDSELPGQAGNQPVRTSHRARSPLPSQAAQAGGSTRSMTRAERIAAFAARMG